LVIQSLRARPFRTIVTITCVAVVIGTMFSTTLIVKGAENSLQTGISRMGADLIVVPKPTNPWHISQMILGHVIEHPYYMDISIVEKLAEVRGVQKATPQAYAAKLELVAACPCCPTSFSYLIGFEPMSDFIVEPWLRGSSKKLSRTDAVVGCNVAALGTNVVIFDQVLETKQVLEKSGTGLDDMIFITLESLYWLAEESRKLPERVQGHPVLTIAQNQISAVLIRVEPGYSVSDVGTRIKVENMDLRVIYPHTLGQEARERLLSLHTIFLTSNGIMWGLLVVMVGTVFSLIVHERRREIGLLRAVGATRRWVFKLIILEVTLPVVFAGALGILGGVFILRVFGEVTAKSLDVPYLWPDPLYIVGLIASGLALSAATGVLGAIYPAFSSSRMEPYDAIRRGE